MTEVRYLPCSSCGSQDALTDYGNRTYCFSCNTHTYKKRNHLLNYNLKEALTEEPVIVTKSVPLPIDVTKYQDLVDRGITKATASFYSVWRDGNQHVYPYFSRDGKTLAANKFRNTKVKGFLIQGDMSKTGLFGQQLFPPGSAKQITVTEGELDALSVYQMTGSKYPAVSVKNAATAPKDIADNFEYLNSFDRVVICFDKDEAHKRPDGTVYYPGQDAAEKVAAMFPLGKVRLLTLKDAKDANDYLKQGWQDKFQDEWWKAGIWSPVGIKQAADLWDIVKKKKYAKYESAPYPWQGLNDLTYGLRTSELVTITANPKVGKTSVLREIVYNILSKVREHEEDRRNIGVMYLEEPNDDTLYGLLSLYCNKPLHLPDVLEQTSEEELAKYFKDVYGDERIYLWDHFGSNSIDKVLTYVRYLANLGCKYIVLDHLSIIVSDQSTDERKGLDEIATKLKMLTMELDICIIVVIHQNRKGEIRGTQGVEQLSNVVIKLYRDPLHDDEEIRNLMKVNVEANRFCGRTGPACLLSYDPETSRLIELSSEELHNYLDKGKDKKDEW